MQYQIVATLGPRSDTEPAWQAMLEAGVTGFRLNTSHLSLEQLEIWLERLSAFLASSEPKPPVVLDLQGSKWRLGEFPACTLVAGQRVTLICAPTANQPQALPVPHPDFFRAAAVSSGEVVLNDARVRLAVEMVKADTMTARVLSGRALTSRKGITYTASTYRQEALSDRDQAILAQTQGLDFVRYALSYVKDAVEMTKYRAQFGYAAHLIAKLERQPAVDEAGPIAAVVDELWLCRGDLGAEVGISGMAETTARFSQQVRTITAPVLLAGQVLEHMTEHPTPTRSEVCHLYDVLQQGYTGVVLSDETAIGRYPVESCQAAALFKAKDDQIGQIPNQGLPRGVGR
jgi:pyruvate kinase